MTKKGKKIKLLKRILFSTNRYGGDMFYPPAVIWKKDLDIKEIRNAWQRVAAVALTGKETQDKVGLYFHVPFCLTKCFYCNCVSISGSVEETHEAYLDCVEKEIKALSVLPGFKIKTFCAGGGTPSILSERNLEKMLKMAHNFFDFSECQQAMIEVSPSTISSAKIKILKNFGINKVTLGVQTLDEKLLKKLNRYQDKKMVLSAFEQLRKHKIKYINIDLMAGLPGQSVGSFLKTLNDVLKLKPDTIHLNPFLPLFFTPFALSGGKIGRENLKARTEMIKRGTELIRSTYPFALEKEGLEKENQQLFNLNFSNSSILGLGWGALSHAFSLLQYGKENFIQKYQNIGSGLGKYMKTLNQGGFPKFFGCRLSEEDEMRAYLIRFFESNGAVDQNHFKSIFGANPLDVFPNEFRELEDMKVIERTERDLKLIAESRIDFFVLSRIFFSKKATDEIKKTLRKEKFDLENIDKKLRVNFCDEPV